MSMFNTEVICLSCKEKERAMPEYKAAQEEELRQVLAGNRNFEGVGFPGK
jgi:nitrate/TMAO reductase-like tetraheme cytochrome c subunit